MRKNIILLLIISFSFIVNTVNAIYVPILGVYDGSIGRVVFPDSVNGVFVNTDAYVLDNTSDMQISGNFWLKNISSSSDLTLGWVTFDHGVGSVPEVVLKNNRDNTFTFEGYAWSKATGWIYFSPILLKDDSNNDITNSKVIYYRGHDDGKGRIEGCAASQNMGFICFDGITLDTTPPHLFNYLNSLSMVSGADNNATITLNEQSTINIQNWTNSSMSTYVTDSTFRFQHDMRNASNIYRDYSIIASDKFGNTSTGYIKIVANIPDSNLSSYNVGGPGVQPTTYSGTLGQDKIADGTDKHSIDIKLRDTYGNPIVPIPGIKDVFVNLGFTNNVDNIQVGIENDLGDAINFYSSDFYLFGGIGDTSDTGSTSNGNYSVDLTSLSPTKEGYSYTTTNNDISVNKLDLYINALNGNSGIGEGNYYDIHNSYYSYPYKFTPAIKVDGVINDNNWIIYRDHPSNFTITGSTNKTSGSPNLTWVHITHLFDTLSGTLYQNNLINFQVFTGAYNNTTCFGNYKNTGYYYSDIICDRSSPYSSNIIKAYPGITSNYSTLSDTISTTPRVVTAGLTSFDTKYSSVVYYRINGIEVKYNSYTTSSSLINNSQIKIAGIVNNNKNNFSVVSNSSINYIGNITKLDVYTLVNKNVSKFRKAGTGTIGTLYMTGNYILNSWPSGINTIISDGGDIIIGSNITKTPGTIKTIIALKDSNGTKGNIWINNNVQFIGASLITDRSILSGDGIIYYSDTNNASSQLFIKGSVLSYNSIGGSSNTVLTCPYYISAVCDLQMARRYDFNHIRSYINGVRGSAFDGTSYGVNMSLNGYANAPMIIEYDSDIQRNIPNILKK